MKEGWENNERRYNPYWHKKNNKWQINILKCQWILMHKTCGFDLVDEDYVNNNCCGLYTYLPHF